MLTQLFMEAMGSNRNSAWALCHAKAALGFADPSCFQKQCRCPISLINLATSQTVSASGACLIPNLTAHKWKSST